MGRWNFIMKHFLSNVRTLRALPSEILIVSAYFISWTRGKLLHGIFHWFNFLLSSYRAHVATCFLLASWSSVLKVWLWNPSKDWITQRNRVFPSKIEVQSKSSLRGRDRFCFDVCLNTVGLLHLSSINVALKFTISRKRQLYSVNLGQQFYQTCQQNSFFKGIQWYHSNLNALSPFYFISVWNVSRGGAAACITR